jgi:hypothetical protein
MLTAGQISFGDVVLVVVLAVIDVGALVDVGALLDAVEARGESELHAATPRRPTKSEASARRTPRLCPVRVRPRWRP